MGLRNKKWFVLAIVVVAIAGVAAYFIYGGFFNPTSSNIPEQVISDEQQKQIKVVAENLDTPWSIAVLPDERLLVTERNGTMRILGDNNQQFTIADVVEQGEGGLLGVTLHPDFESNQFIYVYKTTGPTNVVERYKLNGSSLSEKTSILANIPAAANHNGGEIKFGPDKKLYITTGDAGNSNLAQDKSSLAGKILRVNDNGNIPSDNPFGNSVWSYGHRNPQGLAWDNQNRLWSTEHGPSGFESGFDELNLIQKGGNYGWPLIRGDEKRNGLISPVAQSDAEDTWAPGGLVYNDGNLYFTGLRGQTLYKAAIQGDNVTLTRHLSGTYGRLRAVTVRDDMLLISTSNKDGRGTPKEGDDKIISLPFGLL